MPLINADQLDTSPPRWLVDGLIPEVGLGVLHGPSYTGKSLVVDVELALAVANGTQFFRRDTVQGNVALCLGEGLYDAGVRKQARLARQQQENDKAVAIVRARHGQEFAEKFAETLPPYTDERLFVKTEPFSVPVTRGAGSGNEDSFDRALSELKLLPDLALVILDSMADFSGGLSISNDTSANRYVLGAKRLLRELDCVVLIVGHDRKDGKDMLGATRFYNASDFVFHVVPEETEPGDPASAVINCTKSKYGKLADPVGYQVQPVEWETAKLDDDGEPTEEMITVSSATVVYRTAENGGLRLPGQGAPRPTLRLPELRAQERPRKRTGVKQDAELTEAAAVAAAAEPEPQEATA